MLRERLTSILFHTVPGDAPMNVKVEGSSSSSVLVTWFPPSVPNGMITSYTLYINYTDGSPIDTIQFSGSTATYTVSGLQPYQLVKVHISASTSAGDGPTSELTLGRAKEEGTIA